MKRIRITLLFAILLSTLGTYAQSGLPNLKDNATAKQIIGGELENLYFEYKTNPTFELERRINLFSKAIEILDEPTAKPVNTEYALNSAFLYFELKYNGAPDDSEAFRRLNTRQWSSNFNDLVNLVKK